MMKKRVWFISQFVVRDSEPGSNRNWDFVCELNKHFDVEVFISGLSPHTPHRTKTKGRFYTEIWNNIPVHCLSFGRSLRKSVFHRMAGYFTFSFALFFILLFRSKPDFIFLSIQPPLPGLPVLLLKKIFRVAYVLEVRDVWTELSRKSGLISSRQLASSLSLFISQLCFSLYRNAEFIAAMTPGIKRLIEAEGIDPNKVTTYPNGFPSSLIDQIDSVGESSQITRDKLSLKPKDFVAMYAGAMSFGNNDLPSIIKAASLIKENANIHFVLIGDGERKAELESKKEELQLSNVHFLASVPKTEIFQYLKLADCCLLCTPKDKFFEIYLQNKMFDYMGSKKPIVGAVIGDQKHAITEGNAGLVINPEDPAAIANAIKRLESNREMTKELGENARQYVVDHFERSQIIQNLITRIKRQLS